MNVQTDTSEIKSLSECQHDAVLLVGLIQAIDHLEIEETQQNARVALNAIALERISLLAMDLNILEDEARK